MVKGGSEGDVVVPGPKTKLIPERDLIGIHEPSGRLLLLSSTSDYEETLSLSGHLLRNKEQVCIHTRLCDAHVYILKKWVVDFLIQTDGFSTLKGELLPYIVKKQTSRASVLGEHDKLTSLINANMKVDEIFNCFTRSELEEKVDNTTLYTDTPSKRAYNGDTIRCFASKLPFDMFGTRVHTTQNYYAINQKITKIWTQLFDGKGLSLISPNATIKSTQIVECAVGDGTVIAEKTSLKNSVLGRNCQIIEKVRISDSVLMNGVVIEERVVLESCIVCDNVVIKSGSVLKSCLIGPNYIVATDTKSERVHLTNADGFMEIE
ncbi:hypothetical protein HA402_003111 [Bradysia odoriphaga]|nr:hypothetical protein HA402_003111 [Bradysia odoriphaga]